MLVNYSTEADAYELGFELGFEGQPLPDLDGAEVLGFEAHRYADLYCGWRSGVYIADQMMAELAQRKQPPAPTPEEGEETMKLDSRISVEEAYNNPHLTWNLRRQQERAFRRKLTLVALLALAVAVLLLSGCSTTARRVGSLGAMSDGNNTALQGRFATFEEGKIGGFGAVAAGGGSPRGDEFGEETGPFVPGPSSALSNRSGESFLAAGGQAGITYQPHANVGVLVGMSLWGEETYSEYSYTTPFSGSGNYYEKNGVDTKVGAVIGLEFFNDSGWTFGIQYDSAPGEDGMIGASVGVSF